MKDADSSDEPERAIVSRDLPSFTARIERLVFTMDDALRSGDLNSALDRWVVTSPREMLILNYYWQLLENGYGPVSRLRPS